MSTQNQNQTSLLNTNTMENTQPTEQETKPKKDMVRETAKWIAIVLVVFFLFLFFTSQAVGSPSGDEFVKKIQTFEKEYVEARTQVDEANLALCKKESEGARIKVLSNATYPTKFPYSQNDLNRLVTKRDQVCGDLK